jgi:hypothetical protein
MSDYQNAPIQDGSEPAPNEDALSGIVEQVRADVQAGHTHETVLAMLFERCAQSGVTVSDERARALADEIMAGS